MSNILSPIVDALWNGLPIIYDKWGNLLYRIIEGKSYEDVKGIDGIDFNLDSKVEYEFIPISPGSDSIVNVFKLNDIEAYEFIEGGKNKLEVCIGIDVYGNKVWLNMLNSHLLIGGMARQGKSSLLNNIMVSFMLNYTPNEVKLLLCDFKQLDGKQFDKYIHSIGKCASNKEQFLAQIKWLDKECNKRAEVLAASGCLNAIKHNKKCDNKLTYILYVIDELPQVTQDKQCREQLHLMMSKCAAYGIYIIALTQDCSKDVIGRMKMNCSQTIGLRTRDEVDGKLLMPGAELENIKVKGRCKIDVGEILEFQSYYLDEEEIEKYLDHLRKE